MPKSEQPTTWLFECVQKPGDFAGEVEKAFCAGAEINARDEFNQTPLYYALMKGHAETVSFLCRHGATLSSQVVEADTPAPAAPVRSHFMGGAALFAASVFSVEPKPCAAADGKRARSAAAVQELSGVDKLLSSCVEIIADLAKANDGHKRSEAVALQSHTNEVDELKAEIQQLESMIQDAGVDMTALADQHAEAQSKVADQVRVLEEGNRHLAVELTEALEALHRVEGASIQAKTATAKPGRDYEAEIKVLEADCNHLQAELDEAKVGQQTLRRRAEQAEAALCTLRSHADDAEAEVVEQAHAMTQLRAENHRLAALLDVFITHHCPDAGADDRARLIHELNPSEMRAMLTSSSSGPSVR